ncbi:MAG: hypothetical protein NT075_05665 [Chloroflexi bacterium]|nr:hypothetical protein [Chloroflexota bacterium]
MIRPFQVGDIFLIQRLSRQSTKLNTSHALLQPSSGLRAALTTVMPWNEAKIATYMLDQRGHELARLGFLQVQKRPGRSEADVLLLAPALDTALGHPAIWQKLLVHYCNEAARQQITRIYVDAPDQPLPVNTFSQVGFRVYTRQTIWRLSSYRVGTFSPVHRDTIRLTTKADEWDLRRLYAHISPAPVQQAEGFLTGNIVDKAVKPPILEWWQPTVRKSFVFEKKGDIQGLIDIAYGWQGIGLQLWTDFHQPDTTCIHHLLNHALTVISQENKAQPIYIGVREYHGGLGVALADYGFAPFTDRAKMVKHVVQWVRNPVPLLSPALESIREAVPTPFTFPEKPVHLNCETSVGAQSPLWSPITGVNEGE